MNRANRKMRTKIGRIISFVTGHYELQKIRETVPATPEI
jgi:hypothetical protein